MRTVVLCSTSDWLRRRICLVSVKAIISRQGYLYRYSAYAEEPVRKGGNSGSKALMHSIRRLIWRAAPLNPGHWITCRFTPCHEKAACHERVLISFPYGRVSKGNGSVGKGGTRGTGISCFLTAACLHNNLIWHTMFYVPGNSKKRNQDMNWKKKT